MTVEMSGVASVLARIAQIQAGNPAARATSPVVARTGTSAGGSPAGSSAGVAAPDFATALAEAAQDGQPGMAGSAFAGSSLAGSGLAGSGLAGSGLASSGVAGSGFAGSALADAAVTGVALTAPMLGGPAWAGVGASGTGLSGTGVSGTAVVGSAAKYLGVPYVFGGTTPAGLDCSGLVQRAYADLGIALPRVAADQAHVGTAVASLAQAQPGDILAFGNPAHHVALYLGNDRMIAAPEPGDRVKVQSVYETPSSIRRVVPSAVDAFDLPALASLTSVGGVAAQPAASGVGRYAGLFAQAEAQYRLPQGLLAAVAHTESGGNPAAVSPAGAQGLMQLMPSTARGLGVDPWVPAQAVQGAARLLSNYLHSFGSVPLALAAYNAGPAAVKQYGGVPPYAETQNYVAKITNLMAGRAG